MEMEIVFILVCILIVLMFLGGLHNAGRDRFIEYYSDDKGKKL